jgi:hypothetical protein
MSYCYIPSRNTSKAINAFYITLGLKSPIILSIDGTII